VEECRPCYWMNRAIAPGAEEFLKGRGGLRAKILCDGELRPTAQLPRMKADEPLVASPFARDRQK
jgi:MOSC domain-containing protein YiiM